MLIVMWPLAKRVENWIVDRSTARDFTVLTILQRVSDVLDGSVQVYFVWNKTTEAVTIVTFLWQWLFIWRQTNRFSLLAWSCALLLLSDELPIMPINFCDVNFVLFEKGKGWYESKITINHDWIFWLSKYSGVPNRRRTTSYCFQQFFPSLHLQPYSGLQGCVY